ncbi:MAG: hypothetical protein M3198_02825 [Actinomycetota bacterium]|nr:hypothetical protein [Actinomycetota bacterium]
MRALKTITGIGILAAALFAAGALGPFASGDEVESTPVPSLVAPATEALLTDGRVGDTAALEDRVSAGNASATEVAALALTYLQRSRGEADPTYLPRARSLLERSLEMQPEDNFEASLGMASLANASHDFSASVRWSKRAIRANPYNAAPHGVLGDALFELGHISAADAAYQKMIDIRPDVASYVRASYAAQSHGAWDAAFKAMALAIDAAPHAGEEAAFLRHQLGDIHLALKQVRAARRENRIGIELAPGYAPPTVGVAESFIAEGRLAKALAIMEKAAVDLPAIEYQIKLGELRSALGDEEGAADAYASAAERLALYRQNGVRPDVDFILFYADRGIRLRAGLREARAIFADRPTDSAADALAWMLHANGKDRAAAKYSINALARATVPDPLQHFHAGVIAEGLDQERKARHHFRTALDLDPRFSIIYAPEARRALSPQAGGGR